MLLSVEYFVASREFFGPIENFLPVEIIFCLSSFYLVGKVYWSAASSSPNLSRGTKQGKWRAFWLSLFVWHSFHGRGKTLNAERRMQNAERRMHCLLAVSFTCVCLRLAFICWKGQHFIVFGPFQQIKANRKQTQVKLTASKQCIRRSAFCIRRSAFYPCRSFHY